MSAREIASLDGHITPTHDARLPLPDDGLYRGDGAFEVIRLYAGAPFALAEHLDRLERSGTAIDLTVDRAAVERELEPLLAENGENDAQLRIMITRGGRRILLIEPLAARADSVTLATVTYQPSVILNRVKSLSYAANMHATRIAKARGADEAVFITPDGVVLEPPTSTIFWADENGVLKTPSLENPILDSITRDRLIRALSVTQGVFDLAELQAAPEAFLASTTREVQPVAAIDGEALDWPGSVTSEAQATFARVIADQVHGSADGP